ncbi:MAG: Gfo/Idh/MocA family oxidoreductase [Clostridia bacterium]|nr:Gfo/Idh/MocA family oxidoreductase [Clostridia bacterium]
MKNVCIVGCGAISGVHIEAIKNCKNATLYGICDIDEAKKHKADNLGVRFFKEFDDVLADKNIDSLHICTPHYLHFEMIKKALSCGKTVVCEKPCVITMTEFNELKKLKGIETVCFVMQNRLNRAIVELKKIIDNKTLGNVTGVNAILAWHRTKDYYNQSAWRGNLSTEGGGVLINQAIHALDLMSYLAGDIVKVKANMANYSLSDVIEVEDTFVSYMELKDDVKGMFFATNANAEDDDFSVTVYFEKGKASYILGKLFINNEEVCENKEISVGKRCWGSGHKKLISDFYDENVYFNIESVENTYKALFAMYESARNNGTETLI